MRIPVHMPQIGYGQDTATVLAWLRSVGERVDRGDAIVEVEVEKTDIEIEVLDAGTVVELCCAPGETIAVGQIVAYLEGDRPGMPAGDGHDREVTTR